MLYAFLILGGSHGFVIGHVAPEAQEGGPIALIEDGDNIEISIANKEINLKVIIIRSVKTLFKVYSGMILFYTE